MTTPIRDVWVRNGVVTLEFGAPQATDLGIDEWAESGAPVGRIHGALLVAVCPAEMGPVEITVAEGTAMSEAPAEVVWSGTVLCEKDLLIGTQDEGLLTVDGTAGRRLTVSIVTNGSDESDTLAILYTFG